MNPILLFAILVVSLAFVRKCFLPLFRLIRLKRALAVVPTPAPGHWLWGHIPDIMTLGKDEERLEKWTADGKKLFRMDELILTEINLVHPETVAVLLKTTEPKAEFSYGNLREWLGDGLLISTGKRWARDRRLLTRGFHFDILRGYLPIYKEAVGYVLDQWAEACRQGDGVHTVNMTECMTSITLETILRCIMSFNPHTQSEEAKREMNDYTEAVNEISRLLHTRYMNPHLHSNFIFALSSTGKKFYKKRDLCRAISLKLITERRRAIAKLKEDQDLETQEDQIFALKKESATGYLDFLDILLTVRDEDGTGLSDKEIQEQVDTFLFEGHDTTASALQWTLWYLAKHPDLQEKCRQEAQGCLDENKELSYENLGKLLYLTQFIKESMRLNPPVPYTQRSTTQPMVLDGYNLPKGSLLTVAKIGLHRHPEIWEEPLRFDPDRFSTENSAKRHPYAFVPFSAGPRNCIGQTLAMDEMKTVIALILLRFQISVNPSVARPKIHSLLVSRPSEDIRLQVKEI